MKKFNLNKEDRKNMEDIVELMRNEKEDYGAAYECGVMDGEKRGEKRGEARGEKRGINKGITKVAKSMYQENIDINIISKVTGLTKDQLVSLR